MATKLVNELLALPNLGPASVSMLQRAGIVDLQQLQQLGAVKAYRLVQLGHSETISLHLLYSLHGALTRQHWAKIAAAERTALLLELDAWQADTTIVEDHHAPS